MAKIRWSDIEGQQVSQFFLGEMYQFEYETFEADKYYDAFPVIFVLRRNQKNKTTGDKYIDGVNFHYYDLPRRIELFRSMSRFFTNKILTDEEEDDDDLDNVIGEITKVTTTSKTLSARIDTLKHMKNLNMNDPIAKAMSQIPDDTYLRAREYRNLAMVSRKYRAAKVAYRRYSVDKIRSKIIRIEPKQWYAAVVERSQRFFTTDFAKIKGQRVWQETLIKLRRSV